MLVDMTYVVSCYSQISHTCFLGLEGLVLVLGVGVLDISYLFLGSGGSGSGCEGGVTVRYLVPVSWVWRVWFWVWCYS